MTISTSIRSDPDAHRGALARWHLRAPFGPPGVGKSRLLREAGAGLSPTRCRHGVCEGYTDPRSVPERDRRCRRLHVAADRRRGRMANVGGCTPGSSQGRAARHRCARAVATCGRRRLGSVGRARRQHLPPSLAAGVAERARRVRRGRVLARGTRGDRMSPAARLLRARASEKARVELGEADAAHVHGLARGRRRAAGARSGAGRLYAGDVAAAGLARNLEQEGQGYRLSVETAVIAQAGAA